MKFDGSGQSGSASGDVYAALRHQILHNSIAPGSRLNIDAIARELSVSHTPVREAIRRLEGDQLIRNVPGSGYFAAPLLTYEELRDLYEFRLVVDLWAIRQVMTNRISNPTRNLRAEVDRFELAIERKEDIRTLLLEHDQIFHGEILNALGNTVIKTAYDNSHCHFHAFRLYAADITGETTLKEHRMIVSALLTEDVDEAVSAVKQHLLGAFDRFRLYFDAESQPPPIRLPSDVSIHM